MKTVLITGAARRIGRQLALELSADGWSVAIHCNSSRDEAEALARVLPGPSAIVQADLASPDAAKLVNEASAALGGLSALVNNASIFEEDETGSITQESWTRHLDINLRAPVFLAQAFAAQLPAGECGNIINIIDQRVWRLTPKFFSYTISKSALWTATQTLAQALAPRIRVNAIGPGPALASARMDEAAYLKQAALTLLERGTTPAEISAAAKFILSQPAMTGQMIALDGGQHLSWKTPDVMDVEE